MFHATPAHLNDIVSPQVPSGIGVPSSAASGAATAPPRVVAPSGPGRSSADLTHRGPTAPLRIVVLDGHPTTEVFDVAAAPREIAVAEQHAWADAFAALAPRVVGVFERRAADQCLRDGAPLPSWVQRDIVEWSDAGFTPNRYRTLAAALEDTTLLRHPAHPLHDEERGAHPVHALPYARLRPEHWADWAARVASGADPVIEATVVLDSFR